MSGIRADKRTQLIETALRLFYRRGIHAVGINEVLKESGIAKKTLYSHFGSKEELIAATVKHRSGLLLGWMVARLTDVPSGKAGIEVIFAALDDWFNERVERLKPFNGCFFINASAEYHNEGCAIFDECKEHKLEIGALLLQQCRAVFDDEKKAQRLQASLVLLMEGSIISAHVMRDKQAALRALETARTLIGAQQNSLHHQ